VAAGLVAVGTPAECIALDRCSIVSGGAFAGSDLVATGRRAETFLPLLFEELDGLVDFEFRCAGLSDTDVVDTTGSVADPPLSEEQVASSKTSRMVLLDTTCCTVQGMREALGPRHRKAPGSFATRGFIGGDDGNRTHDPLLAKQVL
jgi:hypothetical protein